MISQRHLLGLIYSTVLCLSGAQSYEPSYEEYADSYENQDNLYASYAMKQQQKEAGAGGPGFLKLAIAGGVGWIAGAKFHSDRASKALKKKHMKEAKTLYSQYYNDVYKLQEQNAELAQAVQQLQTALQQAESERELENMQRDYDEFKQPDVDGDDRISRAEFNMYIKNYLSNFPGLTEKDYPRFDDFDHDGDGYINFSEYTQQMAAQAKKAEQDARRAAQSGSQAAAQKAGVKAQAYQGLSGSGRKVDNFDDLYAQYARR
mmetsp:Transcript_11155/g.20884  ORF Transcript_11155/g.20884 Transcript_11155/m.20884 type:complete len:261 (+) Transcript_11155:157-939(+)